MSTPSPTQSSTFPDQSSILTDYPKFKHYAALTLLIGTPILISIPPRKLDLYTFALAGAFVASANQLTVERTGRGLIAQFGGGRSAYGLRIGEEAEMRNSEGVVSTVAAGQIPRERGTSLLEEKVRSQQDWKEARLKEEQEKLNEGEGYGGMIMDQIWAVWNQEGKKTQDQEKEK